MWAIDDVKQKCDNEGIADKSARKIQTNNNGSEHSKVILNLIENLKIKKIDFPLQLESIATVTSQKSLVHLC